jgi:hypothetical protein
MAYDVELNKTASMERCLARISEEYADKREHSLRESNAAGCHWHVRKSFLAR